MRLRPAFLVFLLLACVAPGQAPSPLPAPAPTQDHRLSAEDEAFLEDLSRRSFQYFLEQTGPETGLVLDRARTDASSHDEHHRRVGSIAATGFGLTALCIGAERGWLPRDEARQKARATLTFFADRAFHKSGWFYHWLDVRTGERRWQSEISSIDTALLLAGILTCRQYFSEDREIAEVATRIFRRVDFRWMLNRHPTLLSHGWYPETGFILHRWDTYSEHTMLYLMGIGSRSHPLPVGSWQAWTRDANHYAGYSFVGRAPLFTHQFSHAWVDFRGRAETRDGAIDYFANSRAATRAHRQFCLDLRDQFPSYSENLWGITASDSVFGYVAWGGPPPHGPIDGTIVPCAAAGSLMFTPDISLPALRAMRERFGDRIYGRYGFVDAFNPTTGWVGPDVIGIDVGITLLSAENLRTGRVWRWFMGSPEIQRGLERAGLRPVRISAPATQGQGPSGDTADHADRLTR